MILRMAKRRLGTRCFGQLVLFLKLQLSFHALVADLKSCDYFVDHDHLLTLFLSDSSCGVGSHSHASLMARLLWDNLEF